MFHGERHQELKLVSFVLFSTGWLAAKPPEDLCVAFIANHVDVTVLFTLVLGDAVDELKQFTGGLFSVTGCAGCTFGFDACSFLITDEQTHLIVHR